MLRNPARLMTLLVLPALLIGCSGTSKPVAIATDRLCESWKHQTVSRKDKLTEETASQIEGSNKARPAWGCQYGESRAKGAGA